MPSNSTPQAKLEAVRAAIVKANPRIYDESYTIIRGDTLITASPRPIRLADAILALPEHFAAQSATYFQICKAWNLRSDSLDSQSPETISFLHSLLCNAL